MNREWLYTNWQGKTANANQKLLPGRVASFLMEARGIQQDASTYEPLFMKDMHKAIDRILEAVEDKSKILIHGDYDVDGLTATAIIFHFLQSLGADVAYYIPNRLDEGYGLKEGGVDRAKSSHTKLLITVDCGIRSLEEVKQLNALGIDVIVTDHHEVGEEIPLAYAVINPHQATCTYPFESLAGAGVVLKLVEALSARLDIVLSDIYYALAALGTVADVMPLRDENRGIVRRGIEALRKNVLPGISEIFHAVTTESEELTAQSLAYKVIPKLNAAGRMGDPVPALKLLLSSDSDEIQYLVKKLLEVNEMRRKEEILVLEEIQNYLAQNPNSLQKTVLLLRGENWHPGVLGIVASRVKDQFHKPNILFSSRAGDYTEDGVLIWRGSGRSLGDFDLYQSISEAEEYLVSFGGHKGACGVSLSDANWEDFCAMFEQALNINQEKKKEEDFGSIHYYDAVLSSDAINLEEAEALLDLGPFGNGNEEPSFLFLDLELLEAKKIGKDQSHLRLSFRQGNGRFNGIGFGLAHFADWLMLGHRVTVLGKLKINEWKGQKSHQIIIEDILLPGEEKSALGQFVDSTLNVPEKWTLEVSDFVILWKVWDKLIGEDTAVLSLRRLQRILRAIHGKIYALKNLQMVLEVFQEAKLIEVITKLDEDVSMYRRLQHEQRVKLSDTPTWQNLLEERILNL